MEAKQMSLQAIQNIYWKCCICLNYLFGANNRYWGEVRGFFTWFSGGGVFRERRVVLVFLKCLIFIFLIFKFVFKQFIFPHYFV